jgi:hypothetical protein
MARNKPYSGAALLAMLLALVGVVAAVACAPGVSPHPLDLATVAACPGEDGPGVGGQPVPCVWDAQTMGNGLTGRDQVRWTLYVGPDGCPEVVQSRTQWRCVLQADWTGGVVS